MELLEQCQIWHENDEYQKIINAIEALPEESRTPELDSELARAYNNLAGAEDKKLFEKAIALLKPHEEYFQGDHCWNFRMGYAYYFLGQEGVALHYFEKALESRPGDKDTQKLIDYCYEHLSLPHFDETFRERTKKAWAAFEHDEAELRRIIDENNNPERGDELVAKCDEILHLAFEDVSFEMGFNGVKHELILTPEGDKVKLFELAYFQRHAPVSVLERWNILVGRRRATGNIGLQFADWKISCDDVQVWVETQSNNSVGLTMYCEMLLPLLQDDENRAWWMLSTLTDQVLGEIPAMLYIDQFDVLQEPKKEPAIFLSQLPNTLEDMGLNLSADPEAYLENYIGYKMEPNKDPDADWRLDVIAGSTCCPQLINGYLNADDDVMDALHADGVTAGFLCYPLDGFAGEEQSQKIFDFRDALEAALTENVESDTLTLIGGATGIYCGYVDFIAWDGLSAILKVAQSFFEQHALPWASFHVFRRDTETVPLLDHEYEDENEEQNKTLEELEYIPYTPDNADAFYQQIEQWNDDDEYTRCIQVLENIPNELWDYRSAYALARALENYAIIGDHEHGTPREKGDSALHRAIAVLEDVREAGENKAEWNMRMAYAYQYLEQEEKSIPYAQRWAELDPEDENAEEVIKECREELEMKATFNSEEQEEAEHDNKGSFTGFVLLSDACWDKAQLIHDLKEKWNIIADENDDEDADENYDENDGENAYNDVLLFDVGDMIAVLCLMPAPIPDGEAEINAENNYMWPEAVEAAKSHKAHIMVAVLGKEENLLERGKLYTKLVAACCCQNNAIGVYTSGVVFEPRFYECSADMMKENKLPIFNWIWFGLYRREGGICGYTYGMNVFGKEEMEVLDANAEPNDLRDFLASVASYVLECDVELHDGETIGFSQDDKHAITRSEGVALPGMTLKISYAPKEQAQEESEQDVEENCCNMEMDNGTWHLESIQEKKLPVDEINSYNHMSIYLRWCIEHDLMSETFMDEYSDLVKQVRVEPSGVDLRIFIREKLDGQLFTTLFSQKGQRFAHYYYGEGDAPYYPSDIDNYALEYFGTARYHSNEFKQEAYLYIPFDESYYQAMAKVIEKRFENWQGQEFANNTEPSELAVAMLDYLDCECQYFPPMRDDDPITSAFSYAQRLGVREGFIPMLIKVDETMWECFVINSAPDSENADGFTFSPEQVENYRKATLTAPVKDGRAVLTEMLGERKTENADDDIDWEDILGKMEGGGSNNRFSTYWNSGTNMTYPLILAQIPVKNPWEVFAYLPFGGWNECPNTPELMAVAKYWFEQYGAVPAAITHDELEFVVPTPVPKENAMELATEQYSFCPDIIDQGPESATVGLLADTLQKSSKWYFWWD